ncbi:MAG TPA: hypothetical protein VKX16_17170 [Chloroflexota bacterium]|nr:hypothetical protein [Chloroflexota bacterium]
MAEDEGGKDAGAGGEKGPPGVPSNPVYDRVGDEIKIAAHMGVRRGMTAPDIIRQIATEHGVHLNVGELRLLLAGRRVKE